MENNDTPIKPQSTGGLKLMTVFVFVLALHVIVIGGMTTYYLFKGGNTDTDMLTSHKTLKATPDGSLASDTPTSQEPGDKTSPSVMSIPSDALANNTPAPAPAPAPAPTVDQTPVSDQTPVASTETNAPASTTDMASAPEPRAAVAMTTAPIPAATSDAALAPEPAPTPTAPTAAATVASAMTTVNAPAPAPVTPAPTAPAVTTPTPAALLPPADPTPATASAKTTTVPATSGMTPLMAATPAPADAIKTDATTPAKTDVAATTEATPAPKTVTDSAPESTYVVKQHDSLEKIAHNNHTTIAKLKAANNLNSDFLSIGQKLVIPAHTATAIATTTTEASAPVHVASTSAKTEKADKAVKTAKTTSAKSDKAKTTVAKASAKSEHVASHPATVYTVVKGDTLTKIAREYKTTTKAIASANKMVDPAKLSIGEQLTIPHQTAHSTATSTPAKHIKAAQLATNDQQ